MDTCECVRNFTEMHVLSTGAVCTISLQSGPVNAHLNELCSYLTELKDTSTYLHKSTDLETIKMETLSELSKSGIYIILISSSTDLNMYHHKGLQMHQ